MKKWTFALLLLLGTSTSCIADNERPIDVSQLPQPAQQLLTKHFGREYGERYEELAFMASQKAKNAEETWQNGDETEEEGEGDGGTGCCL